MTDTHNPALEGLDSDNKDILQQSIKLISKDRNTFELTRHAAYLSKFIKTAVENDSSATELDVAIDSNILHIIVEYLQHHNGVEPNIVEKPLRSKSMIDVCNDRWDADFIDKYGNRDRQLLYDIISGANYLDINSLLHLACAKVASLIKGQPLDKIKDILSTDNTKNGINAAATTASNRE